MQTQQFNILHTHTRQDVWLGSLAKQFLKKTNHVFSLYMSAPSKKGFFHRFVYGQLDAITSSSEILNKKIKKNFPVHPSCVHLIRYGREVDLCEKNKEESFFVRKLWNTTASDIVFATMCRLDQAKGVREIAESFLQLSKENQQKIKLWIIGEPTLLYKNNVGEPVYEEQSLKLHQELKNFVDNAKGRIELIPFQKTPRPYLEAIDVFILGTYKETYSLAVLDAMGVGVPVIGTNSGGTPEQVTHGKRGFLVEPKSATSIAKAIEYYIENKNEIVTQGNFAKQWVHTEHNWLTTLVQFEKLYKNLE